MQHTSIPFTLAFGPQGCMAEVKGRVVAVWCHAELSRVVCGRVDFPQFIPHKSSVPFALAPSCEQGVFIPIKSTRPQRSRGWQWWLWWLWCLPDIRAHRIAGQAQFFPDLTQAHPSCMQFLHPLIELPFA